jgi:hypothetical protein
MNAASQPKPALHMLDPNALKSIQLSGDKAHWMD